MKWLLYKCLFLLAKKKMDPAKCDLEAGRYEPLSPSLAQEKRRTNGNGYDWTDRRVLVDSNKKRANGIPVLITILFVSERRCRGGWRLFRDR